MAVKDTMEGEILHLLVDNGDLIKLDEALEKWAFKDYKSLIRFSVSMLLLAEDKSIAIKMKGSQREIRPAEDLIRASEVESETT
ncbi:MAG: hypothetical protein WA347_04770 [Rhabdochlamydiaceae bacterium]|jgi:hypothetical protein